MAKGRKRSLIKMPTGWKVEALAPRMRACCSACGTVPQVFRVLEKTDAIPYPKTVIYCAACARKTIKARIRAQKELLLAFVTYAKEKGAISEAPPTQEA